MLPMYDSTSSGDEDDHFTLHLPNHQLLHGSFLSDNVDNQQLLLAEEKPKAKKARVDGFRWSPQMDKTLSDCVDEFGQEWEKVCDLIRTKVLATSNGLHLSYAPPSLPSVDDCRKRWKIIHPEAKTFPTWTEQEKTTLARMVEEAQYGDNDYFSKCITIGKSGERVRTISWVGIAQQLKRTADDVSHMWSQIRAARFKRGAFTEAEDQKIIQRAQEWYAMPADLRQRPGLWVTLERELGREDKRISERYRNILSKRLPQTLQQLALPASQQPNSAQPTAHPKQLQGRQQKAAQPSLSAPSSPLTDVDHLLLNGLTSSSAEIMSLPIALTSASADSVLSSDTHLSFPTHTLFEDGLYTTMPIESSSSSSLNGRNDRLHSRPNISSELVRWNDAMDEKLAEAMNIYGHEWGKIANHLNEAFRGQGKPLLDNNKCRGRWYRALRKKEANNNGNTLFEEDVVTAYAEK
eukprot:gene3223-3531_t